MAEHAPEVVAHLLRAETGHGLAILQRCGPEPARRVVVQDDARIHCFARGTQATLQKLELCAGRKPRDRVPEPPSPPHLGGNRRGGRASALARLLVADGSEIGNEILDTLAARPGNGLCHAHDAIEERGTRDEGHDQHPWRTELHHRLWHPHLGERLAQVLADPLQGARLQLEIELAHIILSSLPHLRHPRLVQEPNDLLATGEVGVHCLRHLWVLHFHDDFTAVAQETRTVHLANAGRANGHIVEVAKDGFDGLPQGLGDEAPHLCARPRGHGFLQLLQLAREDFWEHTGRQQ
mmetsp:Transcript_95223/g.211689  ORF Transcript_95223/g.211689 Transcript_95223/m.211689 type:complete len:294 (-) Transcript_95223:892-1773(-)